MRVFLGLWGLLEPGNYLYASAASVARHLGLHYHTCLKAWKELQRLGLLTEERNEWGRVFRYRLAPAVVWRGRPWTAGAAQAQVEAQEELERLARQYADWELEWFEVAGAQEEALIDELCPDWAQPAQQEAARAEREWHKRLRRQARAKKERSE